MRKHLALLVEGDGDVYSVPILVKKALTELHVWDYVNIFPEADRVKNYHALIKYDPKKKMTNWEAHLRRLLKCPNLGGVMLLLDGDVLAPHLCEVAAAHNLVNQAKVLGAGRTFSLAVVFAMQELESWFLASVETLSGIKPRCEAIPGNIESRRDAKGWFRRNMVNGYKETSDQAELTKLVDFDLIRNKNLRSFRRFENAVDQIVVAFRDNQHIASPVVPSS